MATYVLANAALHERERFVTTYQRMSRAGATRAADGQMVGNSTYVTDAPEAAEPRAPIVFAPRASFNEPNVVKNVTYTRIAQPGRFALAGHDVSRPADFALAQWRAGAVASANQLANQASLRGVGCGFLRRLGADMVEGVYFGAPSWRHRRRPAVGCRR